MPARPSTRGCALGLALFLCCATAAAAPALYRLPSEAPETPVVASAIRDYPSAAAAIVGVLARTLQLPMPAYTMEVYGDSAEFEQGLVRHLRLSPDSARSAAGFAKAAVGNRRILVNDPLLSKDDWPERIVTLAHEMVHASQLELAGHRSLVRYQWLTEGSADWAAFRVADALGMRSLATERAATVAKVRAARAKAGLPSLTEMDALPQWIATRRERGFDATYGYAWLAADFLVQRHSHDLLLAYFRGFRDSPDPALNFRAAFGEDLAAFDAALAAHLQQLLQ